LNKLIVMKVFGLSKMEKFKIIMVNMFTFLFSNGKTNGTGGTLLSKVVKKLTLKTYSLKTLI